VAVRRRSHTRPGRRWRRAHLSRTPPARSRGTIRPAVVCPGRTYRGGGNGWRAGAARARATVERWLSGRVSGRLFDDVRLLVAELVTNSVRHAQVTREATMRVGVAIVGGLVRVEVEDPDDGAIAPVTPDRNTAVAFGLYLVENLAERRGSSHDGNTCVWAELAVSAAT
jgi:anti-sigma regulatory factor (Ser/Thr protein kinase)